MSPSRQSSWSRSGFIKTPTSARCLSAAGVHLEMRVALKRGDRDKRAAIAERQPILRAAIAPPLPAARDRFEQLLAGCPGPNQGTEIQSARGIQAEVPHAVRRQPAPIAMPAERLRG